MPFKIVRNDLTKMQVDVIVNPANEEPIFASGTDQAVYKAAGEADLLRERRKIGHMNEGDAAITSGFRLPAKYIIHAVSPRYMNGAYGEEMLLRSCYRKSLSLAVQYHCKSIAFPLIATGSFGYPKEEGMRIAVDEINAFLMQHEMLIYLVVFDSKATQLGRNLYPELEIYIDQNYVRDKHEEEYRNHWFNSAGKADSGYDAHREPRVDSECDAYRKPGTDSGYDTYRKKKSDSGKKLKYPTRGMHLARPSVQSSNTWADERVKKEAVYDFNDISDEDYFDFLEDNKSALEERIQHISDTFQEYLMYLIQSRKLSNAEVYKRAIVTKQLFSKIKLNPDYHPDKATAMRLCVGALLNLDETKDLLARAGYALSPCDKRDIIFSFFIEHKVFDMIEIDIALEEHGLPCFIE